MLKSTTENIRIYLERRSDVANSIAQYIEEHGTEPTVEFRQAAYRIAQEVPENLADSKMGIFAWAFAVMACEATLTTVLGTVSIVMLVAGTTYHYILKPFIGLII